MTKRKCFWLAVLIFGLALPAAAQVAVDLAMNKERYMQYEPIYVRVRLRNFSGRPLVFGRDEKLRGELLMEIIQNRRLIHPISDQKFSLIGTVLQPGQSEEFTFQLNKYYKMTRIGHYDLHAFVRHQKLSNVFRSRELSIEVATGVELWRRTVGVPDVLAVGRDSAETDKNLKTRSYSLRVLNDRNIRHYYVVVEDAKRVYCVICVGMEVSSAPLSKEIDMLNRLHLVAPVASNLYRYMVINLDGKIEQQEFVKRNQDSVPVLVRDSKSGRVMRVGGIEAVAGVDYKVPAGSRENL